jgi:protein involved in polysaccharide export with SLBB domain
LIRNIYTGNTPSDTVIRSLKYALLDANTSIDLTEASSEAKITDADSLGTRIISKQLSSQQKRVALDLNEALRKPGTAADILLEDGDIIKIPVEQQTIQSFGAINYPQQITYKPGMSLKNVINASGGFSANASKKDVYVLEANGRVRSTTHFLGAEVYVPLKARKNPLTKGEVVGITTGLLSLAGVMLAIINTLK